MSSGKKIHRNVKVSDWLEDDIERLNDEALNAREECSERRHALARFKRDGTLPRSIWLEAKRLKLV